MKNICKSQKDCSMSESCIYDIDNKWRCGTFFSSINIIRDIMTNLGVGKYTGPPNVWMEFIDTGYIYNRIDLITIILICLCLFIASFKFKKINLPIYLLFIIIYLIIRVLIYLYKVINNYYVIYNYIKFDPKINYVGPGSSVAKYELC